MRDQTKGFFNLPASETVERNRYGELRKSPKIVKHIFDSIAPKFADRKGGYTRIVKLGKHRVGRCGRVVPAPVRGQRGRRGSLGQPQHASPDRR